MEVLIVGAGAMGRWFGETVTDGHRDVAVSYVDVDESTARRAADALGGRVGSIDGEDSYDAVCLAVPMDRVATGVEQYADRADHAVIDVAGVMSTPLEAMADHAPERERVSLHPLFAPERAPGSIAVVRAQAGPVTNELLSALEDRGNRLVETTAAEHDRAMESVQAAAHTAVLAFALAAEPVPDGFETPVYDELATLVAYVTGGTPRVYGDIQATFSGAEAVAEAARALADADPDRFEALHAEATERWEEGDR